MSLYGLYFTPAFDYLMGTWWGHNLMLVHFLLIGFLYFWGMLGVDPSPRKSARGLRALAGPVLPVLELAATAPFHAFFGVVVMMSTTLLVQLLFHANARLAPFARLPIRPPAVGLPGGSPSCQRSLCWASLS